MQELMSISRTFFGETALMLTLKHGGEHTEMIINMLLNARADVDKQDKGGSTALMLATKYRDRVGEHALGMMRLLVDAGADVDKQDNYWMTALVFAIVERGEHGVGIVRFLVASGARIPLVSKLNIRTTQRQELALYINGAQNWTPLHRAADARDVNAIIKCLSEGMQPDAVVESSHQDNCTVYCRVHIIPNRTTSV